MKKYILCLLIIIITILATYTITTKTLRIETIRSTDEGAILRVNNEEYYIDL